jgi:hypothetical protein
MIVSWFNGSWLFEEKLHTKEAEKDIKRQTESRLQKKVRVEMGGPRRRIHSGVSYRTRGPRLDESWG